MYESKTKIIPAKKLEELRAESREIEVDVVFEDDEEIAAAPPADPDADTATDADAQLGEADLQDAPTDAPEAMLSDDEAATEPPGPTSGMPDFDPYAPSSQRSHSSAGSSSPSISATYSDGSPARPPAPSQPLIAPPTPPSFPAPASGRVAAIPPTAPLSIPRPSAPRPSTGGPPPVPKKL